MRPLDKKYQMYHIWLVAGGSGGTGRGHPANDAIFCYEIHFKHDLPHDIESINQIIQLKNLRIFLFNEDFRH